MKYAYQGTEKGTAKAIGRRLSISTKTSVEICKNIRGKSVEKTKALLQDTMALKRPIKYHRFTDGVGHKSGIGPGRYPVKAAKEILEVVKSAEANAQTKGLETDLIILHATAHQAARSFKYGRKRRQKEKSTHFEIVVKEAEGKQRAPKIAKEDKPKPAESSDKKKEVKKESKSESKPKKTEEKK